MPLYEYRCCQCGAEFERIRPMDQADRAGTCPQCGSADIKRRLSLFASFAHEGGKTQALGGGGSCASCAATSCATCGKG